MVLLLVRTVKVVGVILTGCRMTVDTSTGASNRMADSRTDYCITQSPARGCAGVVSAVSKAAVSGRRSRINVTELTTTANTVAMNINTYIAGMAGGTDSIAAQRQTMGVTSGNSMA